MNCKDERVVFSIFMCARNAEITIERAISSVINQTCKNWELIIIDNGSVDKTWGIIEQFMQSESRVKGIHLEKGVGWAKGASICMEKAAGQYMTFLAADDFLINSGSLSMIQDCIKKENPDIVWIGCAGVQLLNDGAYEILTGKIPRYAKYEEKDRINSVYNLMSGLYYNAFFHYVNIDFLKKYGINFFEPFYCDYEGMTEAMCRAEKMVVLDQLVYALTANTSQTRGSITWRYNVTQWRSIRNAILEYGTYDRKKLSYIAERIMVNNIAMLDSICRNGNVRDKEMNPIQKTSLERFAYVEKCLQTEEFIEMFYYTDSYQETLFEAVKVLFAKCKKDAYTEEEIMQQVKWLPYLVEALCDWDGEQFIEKKEFDEESFLKLHMAICNNENKGAWGYGLARRMSPFLTPSMQGIGEQIDRKYINYNLYRIYELLYMAVQIKQRRGLQEVLKIISECIDILEFLKQCLLQEEIDKIVADIKLVAEHNQD